MKCAAYSVYDKKSELNDVPFFHRNNATAIRYFRELVNRDDHPYNINPEDYSLYSVGTFDQAERDSLMGEPCKLLCEAADVIGA